jgi:hypothetical protein
LVGIPGTGLQQPYRLTNLFEGVVEFAAGAKNLGTNVLKNLAFFQYKKID